MFSTRPVRDDGEGAAGGADMLSIEDIRKKMDLGEDSTLEFKGGEIAAKRRQGEWRKLADEITAFANSDGGVLVFGIDDAQTVTGLSKNQLDLIEKRIVELCNDAVTPPLHIRTEKNYFPDSAGEDRPVLLVKVPASLWVHKSPGGYFHRQGSSMREMPPDILARLMQQRSQARLIRFDEQFVPNTSIDDLEEELWRPLVARAKESDQQALVKCRLLVETQGEMRASVSGILMCSKTPDEFLPGAFIEAVRYRGAERDSNYQIDARRITGPLNQQIDSAVHFIRKNQFNSAVKIPHRRETPQFGARAMFEAVVNAVAHRDYSVHGSKIRLFMFDDRMEIYSPGALPNTVSIDSIHMRQATRNELLTSLLSRCRIGLEDDEPGRSFYLERRGEGVPIIMKESEKLSGRKPQYQLIDNAELLLTIYAYQRPAE